MDLEIPDQSCTALIGPNGIGKTTLLNIMCGCLFPDTGDVTSDTPYFQNRFSRFYPEAINCMPRIR